MENYAINAASDQIDWSVSLNNASNVLAAGGRLNDNANGLDYGYQYDTFLLSWKQVGQDINGEAAGDLAGISVSLCGNCTSAVANGANGNDADGRYAGHARVHALA